MKDLKQLLSILILVFFIWACASSPTKKNRLTKENPVKIAHDSLTYDILIIDPGFNNYLTSIAQPKGFYSQHYLELRNQFWVLI